MAEPIKLDMALDDLVKTDRTRGRGRGRGRGLRGRGGLRQIPQIPQEVGSKLLVSNLHFGVTESDLRELFSSMGPLKKVSLAFDSTGKSKGSAEVIFVRKQDAVSSLKKYNNVALDGRPMKLELTTSVVPSGNIRGRLTGLRGNGTGRGGRGRGNGRGEKKAKTAEELDAEMSAYMQGSGDVEMGAEAK